MKKLFYAVLVLLVLVISGFVLLVNNLDTLVRRAIEVAGSSALGTEVNVGSVELDLTGGSATLTNFSIANPSGFSNEDMVRFDELHLAIDLASLNSEVVRIHSIRTVNPYLNYEMQGTRSNIDALRERFPAQTAPAEPVTNSREPVLALDSVRIAGIQGQLKSDLLPQPVAINLGDVQIPAVQGTPDQLARQIAVPLLTQLGRNAASEAAGVNAELLQQQLRDSANERLQDAEESVRGAADELRNRLGL
ncbi:MAG TPA: hypothetical protein VKZ92_07110 [Pseudohongiella sp.]|nr:hypothetical protein [Pseudohongiella sp.]